MLMVQRGQMPPLETIIYTAGLLDGEGSIQINPSHSRNGGKCYWNLTVQVSSSCESVLRELCDSWGQGAITSWKPRGKYSYRRSFNWRIYSHDAEVFLRTVEPYLRIKRENAQVALEFRKHVGFKKGQLTPEVSKTRNDLAMKLRELNQRYGKGQCKSLGKEVA